MKITTEEIYAYREIYYECIKPMIKKEKTQEQIDACLEYFAPEYGITPERYRELFALDFLQRLAGINNPTVFIRISNTNICSNKLGFLSNMPELRCPKRSEQLNE